MSPVAQISPKLTQGVEPSLTDSRLIEQSGLVPFFDLNVLAPRAASSGPSNRQAALE
jgi:hypothetical protein